ncbi:hypothetical protein [Streptomyces sp. ERV7]|uniref:hypothetical protein n=1 Tax=Streptomyces sp. ERV7 TaxID=1322334 RepID=UPI000B1E3D43|nr:hypothetical protein [Streptomyces sp. ERV7]
MLQLTHDFDRRLPQDRLRNGDRGSVADRYLDSITVANTRRSYTTALGKVVSELGEGRPLSSLADDEIGQVLEQLWGTAAVSTWNSRRGAVGGWLAWCHEAGLEPPRIPAWCKRMPDPGSETPVRSKTAIRPPDRPARCRPAAEGQVACRMLYETVARADELLGVNIEDLNLAARQCPVKVKGAKAVRRRGQAREDCATETIYRDADTARLLPRLIGERTRGPLLVTHPKPHIPVAGLHGRVGRAWELPAAVRCMQEGWIFGH